MTYNSDHVSLEYGPDYFLSDYKKQYGKTYEEDFPGIYAASEKRLSEIFSHITKKNISVLDIGSALGFFLQCARDMGAGKVLGIEISEYAGDYARSKLSIDTVTGSFNDVSMDEKFDVITAWYFLEHCPDPLNVLNRIYDMLDEGGVFAFSAPSVFGPLFVFQRDEWIRTHPVDHRIDFTPRSAVHLLKRIGFRKVVVRTAGLHPERVIPGNSFFYKPFAWIYGKIAPQLKFGDTLEIFAVK